MRLVSFQLVTSNFASLHQPVWEAGVKVGGNAWERRTQARKFCNAAFPGPSEGLFQWECRFCVAKREDSLKAAIASQMQQQHAETSIDDHGFHVEK